MISCPFPPIPMAPIFNRSLGEINPFPPSTFLGTIKNPVVNRPDFFRKFLLVLFFLDFLIIWGKLT